jgi:hypothetical protein
MPAVADVQQASDKIIIPVPRRLLIARYYHAYLTAAREAGRKPETVEYLQSALVTLR